MSSGVSSAASDKLGRVIEQLKKFKIAQTEACPETKSSAGSANKTTHVVSTGGSDVNPGDHHQKEPCNGESRTERIARILKAAKEKRLEPQATKPTADDGDTTVPNPYLLPDHVSWYLSTKTCGILYMVCHSYEPQTCFLLRHCPNEHSGFENHGKVHS